MKIVIVAGGKGTRIANVAGNIPKALIPVAGKPVVEYQIELAKRYGYKDIIFLLGHLGEQIESYFGDGAKWGVHIEYSYEQQPLGTAGAFRSIVDQLTEQFWVFYGDTVMDIDMPRMLQYHRSQKTVATLLLHPNNHPYDSDLVEVDETGIIQAFYPKPHDPNANFRNLVNAACYVLDKKVIDYIPCHHADFGKDIFPALLEAKEKIAGYVSAEYIKDMGTPDRWAQVENDIVEGRVAARNHQYSRPAIFMDRDGVICRDVNLLHAPEQLELLPGAAQAIAKINQSGYLAVIVTNQPVIARNLCSLDDLKLIHNRLETLLGQEHAYVDAIYFCPHHPDRGYPGERPEYKIECECRKPKPGMILQAAKEWNIALPASFMIGDRPTDVEAGNRAGLKASILIQQNEKNALLQAVNAILS